MHQIKLIAKLSVFLAIFLYYMVYKKKNITHTVTYMYTVHTRVCSTYTHIHNVSHATVDCMAAGTFIPNNKLLSSLFRECGSQLKICFKFWKLSSVVMNTCITMFTVEQKSHITYFIATILFSSLSIHIYKKHSKNTSGIERKRLSQKRMY